MIRACLIMLGLFFAADAYAAVEQDFTIKPEEWKKYSSERQQEMLKAFKTLPAEKMKTFGDCVDKLSIEPGWAEGEMGTIMTQCLVQHKLGENKEEEKRAAIKACINKKLPDFSDEDQLSVLFSLWENEEDKQEGKKPKLDPKAEKMMRALKECEKEGLPGLSEKKAEKKKAEKKATKKKPVEKKEKPQEKKE